MWLLNFLPDFVFHLILIVGVLGLISSYLLSVIPGAALYKIQIQVVSIVLIVVGVWYSGGIAKDKAYRDELNEMKLKVAESEKKAAEANGKIEIVYRDKVTVAKEVQVVIQEKITNMADSIDAKCKITQESIDILNSAAKNIKPRETK
jgi:hypothetical protein